jgi:hypothetical protein
MRRRYRQDPKTLELIEVTDNRTRRALGLTIMPDIKPFISPITGREITGRRALREHNKQFNVTNVADFNKPGGQWERQAKERAQIFTGESSAESNRRKEHLIRNWDKLTRRGK